MRFIAAAMVFLFHGVLYTGLFADPSAQSTLGSIVAGGGWTGVSFFFILSGFVLAWSARSSDTLGRFWRRRLCKIFPNHLVTAVVAYVLASAVVGTALPDSSWLNILLLQSWVPDLGVIFTGNVVAWSLSCELLFYLLFPLLLPMFNRIRPERLWLWAGGFVVAILLVPTLAAAITPPAALSAPLVMPVIDMTMWQQWFVALFPPVRLLEFVFGIVLARIVITGQRLPLNLGGAVAFAIAAYALSPLVPGEYRVAATMVIPLGLVIAAGARMDEAAERSWLSGRRMVYLGEISFAVYMVHNLVLVYGHQLLGATTSWATPAALGVLALFLAATLGVAALLYTLVERPVMQYLANPRRRRPSALASVPTGQSAPPPARPDGDRLAG
ncbi:acyltransferase family protein [Actinophytocola algeriensis]|uniref:Mycarose O-acyltransferase n=1 Tax=Actinophytocola algeriensis TaxID=1768010 RepID=A0A7W7Q9J3_9PSEU|nr:mycarose O-acyltransferase [Actinophytocola algeriensis]MBE1475368.1 mycarose O-acyltransferase [Actinophytocola algeriensis]